MDSGPGLDLGYVAGILDARGHFDVPRSRISVTTKREDLLYWLAARTGVGVTTDDRPYVKRPCSDHCEAKHQHVARQSCYWTIRGFRAAIVSLAILPWLVDQRANAHAIARREIYPSQPELTEIGASMARLGWPLA